MSHPALSPWFMKIPNCHRLILLVFDWSRRKIIRSATKSEEIIFLLLLTPSVPIEFLWLWKVSSVGTMALTMPIHRPFATRFALNLTCEYRWMPCVLSTVGTFSYHECGCVDPVQWLARSVVLPGSARVIEAKLCLEDDQCFKKAKTRLHQSETLWNQYCSDCNQACMVTDYQITPSTFAAPIETLLPSLKAMVESFSLPLPNNWSTNWHSELQKSYLSLDVVCQSTLVENFTQEASVSPIDVLSNVGGHTGLWIGISFLSIMEFIEMLYRLSRLQFSSLRQIYNRRFAPQ
jgi:hypothetical protein